MNAILLRRLSACALFPLLGAATAVAQESHIHAAQEHGAEHDHGPHAGEVDGLAIGVVLDGFAIFADAGDEARGDSYNRVVLRGAEFDVSGEIDELGWAYLVAGFGDEGGNEFEFELIEAAIWLDELPNKFSVRAGRYLADFCKWNGLHVHERPFPFEDGARQAAFGGSLVVHGLELHQRYDEDDFHLRWSLGLASSFEGHSHPVLDFQDPRSGEDHSHGFESGSIGDRELSDFAWTGRIAGLHEFGDELSFQWGVSAFLTEDGLLEEHDDGGSLEQFALGQSTLSLDFLVRVGDGHHGRTQTAGLELYLHNRDLVDEATDSVKSADGVGLSGFIEHGLTENWSLGTQASWWERPDKQDGGDWLSGQQAGRQLAVYTSWSPSETQRLRFALAHFDPTPYSPADWVVALHWVVRLGNHRHGLDW
jgi:hypothetical protein